MSKRNARGNGDGQAALARPAAAAAAQIAAPSIQITSPPAGTVAVVNGQLTVTCVFQMLNPATDTVNACMIDLTGNPAVDLGPSAGPVINGRNATFTFSDVVPGKQYIVQVYISDNIPGDPAEAVDSEDIAVVDGMMDISKKRSVTINIY